MKKHFMNEEKENFVRREEFENFLKESIENKIDYYRLLESKKRANILNFLNFLDNDEVFYFKTFLEKIIPLETEETLIKKIYCLYSKTIKDLQKEIYLNQKIELKNKILVFYYSFIYNTFVLNENDLSFLFNNFEEFTKQYSFENLKSSYFELINIFSSFLKILETEKKNKIIEKYIAYLFDILKKNFEDENIFCQMINHLHGLFLDNENYFETISQKISIFLKEYFILKTTIFSEENLSSILTFMLRLQKFNLKNKNLDTSQFSFLLEEYDYLKKRIITNYDQNTIKPLSHFLLPLKVYIDLFYDNQQIRNKIKNEILQTILNNSEKEIAIEFWMISFLVDKLNENDLNPLLNIMFAILNKKNGFVRCAIFEVLKNMMIFNQEFLFKNYFQEIFNLFLNILNINEEVLENFYYEGFLLFVKCICFSKKNFINFEKIVNLILGSIIIIIKKNKKNIMLVDVINKILFVLIPELDDEKQFKSLFNIIIELMTESDVLMFKFIDNFLFLIKKMKNIKFLKLNESKLLVIKQSILKKYFSTILNSSLADSNFLKIKQNDTPKAENKSVKTDLKKSSNKENLLYELKLGNEKQEKKIEYTNSTNLITINLLITFISKDISNCIVDDIKLLFEKIKELDCYLEKEENMLEILDCLNYLLDEKHTFLNIYHFKILYQFANILINLKIKSSLRLKAFMFFERVIVVQNSIINIHSQNISTFYKYIFFNVFKNLHDEKNILIIIKKLHFLKNILLISKSKIVSNEEINEFITELKLIINFDITILEKELIHAEDYYYNLSEFLFQFIKSNYENCLNFLLYLFENNIEKEIRKLAVGEKNKNERTFFNFMLLINHLKIQGSFYQSRENLHFLILKLITHFSRNLKNIKYLLIGNYALGLFAEVLDNNIKNIFIVLLDILNKNINYFENEYDNEQEFSILIKETIYSAFGKTILRGFKYMNLEQEYCEFLIKFWTSKIPFASNSQENVVCIKILFKLFTFYEKSNSEFLDFFLKVFLDIIYECYSKNLVMHKKLRNKIKIKLSEYNIFVSSQIK